MIAVAVNRPTAEALDHTRWMVVSVRIRRMRSVSAAAAAAVVAIIVVAVVAQLGDAVRCHST